MHPNQQFIDTPEGRIPVSLEQRFVSVVWDHMVKRKCKSLEVSKVVTDNENIVFSSYAGDGCAASVLIMHIKRCSGFIRNRTIKYILELPDAAKYVQKWALNLDTEIAMRVQEAHDGTADNDLFWETFCVKLKKICNDYNLVYPGDYYDKRRKRTKSRATTEAS